MFVFLRPLQITRRGFSLLEMALAVGVSGVLMGGLWQMSGMADRGIQSTFIATQATSVGAAAQAYLNANKTTVLALVPAIGNIVRIKVVTADAAGSTPSLQAAGFLPSDFINSNPYGQSYAFYAKREDSGTLGLADANDRLVGLVITTGGEPISDKVGATSASRMGAAGGFMFAADNPASPTAATTIRGVAGGWSIDLTSGGWPSAVGATATLGHVAVYTPLLPTGVSASSGTNQSIDGLDDGKTEYSSLYNVFLGKDSGAATSTNNYGTAIGYQALSAASAGVGLSAFGYQALYANTTGSRNSAFGSRALYSNLTGNDLTAFGFEALYANTSGLNNTAVGSYALHSNQTGNGNTAAGYRSLYTSVTGNYNTALGAQALEMANGASNNTAFGYQALKATTTGSNNTAVGSQALLSNTTGTDNTAAGYMALSTSSTTSYNTAAGTYAMRDTTTGTYNIAVGMNALKRQTTGSDNIAIGGGAFSNSYYGGPTTGSRNISIGVNTMTTCTTQNNNTIVGYYAGGQYSCPSNITAIGHRALYQWFGGTFNMDYTVAIGKSAWVGGGTETAAVGTDTGYNSGGKAGDYDAVIGYQAMTMAAGADSSAAAGHKALFSISSGDGNVGVGASVLYNTTTGNYNTAVGYRALYSNSTQSSLTAVGYQALYQNTSGADNTAFGSSALLSNQGGGSNTAVGASSLAANISGSYNTAVGYQALNTNLNGNNTAFGCLALKGSNSGSDNTAVGAESLELNSTGSNNVAVGNLALYNNTTGSNNTAIGDGAGPVSSGLSNTTAIGYGATVSSSNEIRVGNTSVTAISGQVAWSFPSDQRDKHDIQDSDLGLDFIMQLRPVFYRLNNGNDLLDYGFIAQEVEGALGERQTNMIRIKDDARGSYLFRSSDMISPVVKALQQQGQTIINLKSHLQSLQELLALKQAELKSGAHVLSGEHEEAQ